MVEEIKKRYKKTDVGVIPEDWEVVSILELSEKYNGIKIGPFGSQLKKELLTTFGYKIYGQENVYNFDFDIGERYISEIHFRKLNQYEIKANDFVVSMMGTIGKSAIVPDLPQRGIMDSHLIRIRLDKRKVIKELIFHFFSSEQILDQLRQNSVGGIMDGLSAKIIRNIFVPLPPTIAEQEAIAKVLNDSDLLIRQLEKLIEKKRAIKQGAMQDLLKPKEGWKTVKLENLSSVIGDGIHTTPLYSVNGEYSFINGNNLLNGKISVNNCYKVSIKEYLKYKKELNNKTILISINGTIGNIAFYNNEKIVLGKSAAYINLNQKLNKYYFYQIIQTFFIKQYFEDELTGTTIKNLSLLSLRNTPVPLPPTITEQEVIAKVLNDMDSEIKALEKKLEKYKMIKQGMMQNLLTGKIRLV